MGWKIIYSHESDRCSSPLNMKRSLRLLVEKLKEQNTVHHHTRLTTCMKRSEGKYVIIQAHICLCCCCCCSVAKSCLTLWPCELQHIRPPCPSPSPWVCSSSCSLKWWSSNHLILCCPLLLLSVFPSIRVFSSELTLHIRWSKYWSFSFSISPSDE